MNKPEFCIATSVRDHSLHCVISLGQIIIEDGRISAPGARVSIWGNFAF